METNSIKPEAFKCNCGAITVHSKEFTNSMQEKDFKKNFPKMKIDRAVYGCDYCINHWGIDLCMCGSGMNYKKCDSGCSDCGTPSQELFTKKKTELWKS